MSNQITEVQARRVLEVVDEGLVSGVGNPVPGEMCVEAAVCYALGQPHGDNPTCVAQPVRSAKITLNDAMWSSKAVRAAGLRKVAIAQLGSAGTIDEQEFARYYSEQTIRKIVPRALRSAAALNPASAAKLEAAAVRCEKDGSAAAADAAAYAARAAYAADAADAAARAAAYAADAAAAARAAYAAAAYAAAAYAADAAARAAYAAAYAAADAYAAAASDEVLAFAADVLLDALKHVNSPGCRYLYLCES